MFHSQRIISFKYAWLYFHYYYWKAESGNAMYTYIAPLMFETQQPTQKTSYDFHSAIPDVTVMEINLVLIRNLESSRHNKVLSASLNITKLKIETLSNATRKKSSGCT
jgi:hypothetical protein